MSPQATYLPDGRRLHLNHGPIDLILDAEGPDRDTALKAATTRFQTILTGLISELPALRTPLADTNFQDPTSRRMERAVSWYQNTFVTPMAAVAGAVADEVLSAMTDGQRLRKAYVNNGGDIAFHLEADQVFSIASAAGTIHVQEFDAPRGVATSGWRGRSHSLGIADAVTALASSAAAADVAATLIANAIDLPGHPAITRVPATALDPDSDLDSRLVTQEVGTLSRTEIDTALARGADCAENFRTTGLISAATLTLCGKTCVVTQQTKELSHA